MKFSFWRKISIPKTRKTRRIFRQLRWRSPYIGQHFFAQDGNYDFDSTSSSMCGDERSGMKFDIDVWGSLSESPKNPRVCLVSDVEKYVICADCKPTVREVFAKDKNPSPEVYNGANRVLFNVGNQTNSRIFPATQMENPIHRCRISRPTFHHHSSDGVMDPSP